MPRRRKPWSGRGRGTAPRSSSARPTAWARTPPRTIPAGTGTSARWRPGPGAIPSRASRRSSSRKASGARRRTRRCARNSWTRSTPPSRWSRLRPNLRWSPSSTTSTPNSPGTCASSATSASPRSRRSARAGSMEAKRRMIVRKLGLVEYEDGLALMQTLARRREAGEGEDVLLLLEHPPVLTLGRAAKRDHILLPPEELERRGVRVFETDRGGDVTYHGPGQLVGYPVFDLKPDRKDVRRYVGGIEEAVIRTLADYGITA